MRTTAGCKLFDQSDITGAATLSGTLNPDLINSFIPTIGSTFDIMNFASKTGTFSTINGTAINSNEHFQVVVNATNVTLDVVAGPGAGTSFNQFNLDSNRRSGASSVAATPEPSSILFVGTGLFAAAAFFCQAATRQ